MKTFVPRLLGHQERLNWRTVTHVRLKRGAQADTAPCQKVLDHIRERADRNGVAPLDLLLDGYPQVRNHPTLLRSMRHDLRHMANLRESGKSAENKGLIDLGVVASGFEPREFPDELDNDEVHLEGAKQRVIVNCYERDKKAREKCIAHWGVTCSACSFDFEAAYGARGAGFIHVHHLVPVSKVGENYRLNPVNDLRPVCPNCHAIIHRYDPPASIEDMRRILADAQEHSAQQKQ